MKKLNKLIKFLKAFSTVETLVSVIIISVVVVAFAPIMSKHYSKTTIKASQPDQITSECSSLSPDCYSCAPRNNPTFCTDCEMDNDKREEKCTDGQAVNPVDCHCKDCEEHCIKCSFNARGNQDKCELCEEGYYLNYLGKCVPCSEGHYCTNNENKECEKGTYQDETTQSSCKDCNEGTYQDETGKTECKPCASGMISTEKGSVECTNCSAGTYANPEHTNCPLCAEGTYQNQEAKDSCKPCPAGTYSSEKGAIKCTPCSLGTAQSQTGSTACPACDPGYCASSTGSSACTNCSAAVSHCTACTIGTCGCTACTTGYCPWDGTCSRCAANYYKSGDKCVPCTGNKTTKDCNEETSCSPPECLEGCSSCPSPGRCSTDKCKCGYRYNSSTKTCVKCPAGYYSGTGATACTKCTAGYYCPNNASCPGDRIQCHCGNYSTAGAKTCPICPAGTYSGTGITKCVACTKGYACPNEGTCGWSRVQCHCGQYAAGGATNCSTCDAGTYSAANASECEKCPAGQYCKEKGTCKPTSPDFEDYPVAPANCPKGKYSTAGSTSCKPCAANHYNNKVGNATCSPCPSGKYSHSGATACLNCTAKGCKVCTAASNGATCTTCLNSPWFMHDNGKCYKCKPGTAYYKAHDVCVMTKNIGDDLANLSWPSSWTAGNQYGSSFSINRNNPNKGFCWTNLTTGNPADTVNGYSGKNRTVCTWYAANAFCNHHGGKLTSKGVTEDMLKSAAARHKFNICSNFAGVTNAAQCGTNQQNCKTYSVGNTTANRCFPADYYYNDGPWDNVGSKWVHMFKLVQNSSVTLDDNETYVPRSARCQFAKTQ